MGKLDPSSIRQLTGTRPGRELRWTKSSRQSIRTYAIAEQDGDWRCVSTRSSELTVVLDGEMLLELGPEKQIVRVPAGEACMMPRCMPHALRIERPTRLFIVDTQGAVAESGFRHLRSGRQLPRKGVAPFASAWSQAAARALPGVASAAEALLERLLAVSPLALETIAGARRAERMKRVVEERFVDPPSLAELAKLTKTSEFYAMREFKKHFGFTPLQYAQFLRTEHFCWELIQARTRRTLLRLSAESGFGDYATFERRLRVVFGRAPSALVVDDADGTLGPG